MILHSLIDCKCFSVSLVIEGRICATATYAWGYHKAFDSFIYPFFDM